MRVAYWGLILLVLVTTEVRAETFGFGYRWQSGVSAKAGLALANQAGPSRFGVSLQYRPKGWFLGVTGLVDPHTKQYSYNGELGLKGGSSGTNPFRYQLSVVAKGSNLTQALTIKPKVVAETAGHKRLRLLFSAEASCGEELSCPGATSAVELRFFGKHTAGLCLLRWTVAGVNQHPHRPMSGSVPILCGEGLGNQAFCLHLIYFAG
jgi:hypothetical protein